MTAAALPCRVLFAAGWLLWGWLAALPAAAAPALTVDSGFSQTSLDQHLDLFEDPAGTLTYAEVTTAPAINAFTPAAPGMLAAAPRQHALWLRFALRNPEPDARLLILSILPTDLAAIELYDGATGRKVPAIRQDDTGFVLQLTLAGSARTLYYLRIVPSSPLPAQFALHSLDNYLSAQRAQSVLDSAGIGALLALIGVTLVLALMAREPVYLWLVGYGVFSLITHSKLGDLPPPYTPLHAAHASMLLATTCALFLTLRFPAYPLSIRGWRLALNGLATLNLVAAALLMALPKVPLYWVCNYALLFSLLATIVCSLHAYLLEHRRLLLAYSMTRLAILLAGIAIAAQQGDFTPEHPVLSMLLIALNIEVGALLGLLLWRSARQTAMESRQQQAIAAAEAEGRARTEVIAEVGHRIRTPVSGALGMLEMLQDTSLSATQRDYIATIQRAGNELLNVVDDLSDVSNLEARPGELQQTTFDPQVLVAECVDGFRGLADARRLELISDPEPELPAYVSGDPTRLRQILLHLLHHTVSQCEQGDVVIRVRMLPQHWLRFELSTDAQPAASTAVSAMDRRRHRPASIGLRLAVARQLVDLLGGRIQLREQQPGRLEAAFELPLPMALPSAAGASAGSQEPALRNKQLLVVDDNATFCEVLRRQAGHWGMAVHTATSASEGLARLRNQINLGQPMDALLLDADMQELIDGEWLERLRTELEQLPVVILLTSRAELAGSEHLRQLGVRRALLKPINHTSLKITLAEELGYSGQPAAQTLKSGQAPIRCLVAEDNVINTKVLVGMLQKLGVECTAVGNGQEAVEACQRRAYDIVLMDCDMPIMDGWEATSRIREIQSNRGATPTPIIALTANTVAELGERARQPLMDAHLVKPIHLLELKSLLERWTGKAVTVSRETAPE